MEFKKYMHIERLGVPETDGILDGLCYIFPKIDGTNGSIWMDSDGDIKAGSRNRELTLDNDNQGFYEWVLKQDNIREFLKHNINTTLYGEWLVPHSLKTYRNDAWRKFYVFDVTYNNENIPYLDYCMVLEKFNIDYIPPICFIENPTEERIIGMLDKTGFLIEDGKGNGEGVVIKNYCFVNKYGRQTWAKIVTNEFKEKHSKNQITEVKEGKIIEQEICRKYITSSLIDKEKSKIENELGDWSSTYINRLIGVIFYCLIREESWNFVKEFRNPIIDFRKLHKFCIQEIRIKSNLF